MTIKPLDNTIFLKIIKPKVDQLSEINSPPKNQSQKKQLLIDTITELLGNIRDFLNTEEAQSIDPSATRINPRIYAGDLHDRISRRIDALWPHLSDR